MEEEMKTSPPLPLYEGTHLLTPYLLVLAATARQDTVGEVVDPSMDALVLFEVFLAATPRS